MKTEPTETHLTRRPTVAADRSHPAPRRRRLTPRIWARCARRLLPWLAPVLLVPLLLSLPSHSAEAQGFPTPVTIPTLLIPGLPPSISIGDLSRNEGNPGTTTFAFPVTLSTASTNTVTVRYSTSTLPNFVEGLPAPATGGASCGGTVDFITVTNAMLTFSPGVTSQS